ncbi:MAG: hypothetical protein ABIR36_09910 [Nitrospiraceae bacterium]
MVSLLAQVYPPDTASLNIITSIKSDLLGWGFVIIGVSLGLVCVRIITRLVYGPAR